MKRQVAVGRTHMRLGVLLLTLAVMAFTATAALAAAVSGDGTLVGSTGNDTITAGKGNDIVWGRGGSDTITAGKGNDVIDGGGSCPAGLAAGDYPNGLPGTDYCQHGPFGTFGTDNITAGDGNDTVYGNGGPNNITIGTSKGQGDDTVFAYGGPNNVTIVSNGNDTINAYGTGNYSVGTGDNTINAQYHLSGYTISCGSKATIVNLAKGSSNSISSKCTVKTVALQTPPGPANAPARSTANATSSKANAVGLAVNRLATN